MKFIETIKIKEKKILNLKYHIKRANNTIKDHYSVKWNFENIIKNVENSLIIPDDEVYKLRIVYTLDSFEWSIEKYILQKIKTVKIVKAKNFFYQYKYFDRSQLDELYLKKDNCDNIIIVVNDFITDSYYANLVFQKKNKYFTPSTPLLKGTKREFYLDNNIILEKEIKKEDIYDYDSIHLINAFIDLGEIVIKINNKTILAY